MVCLRPQQKDNSLNLVESGQLPLKTILMNPMSDGYHIKLPSSRSNTRLETKWKVTWWQHEESNVCIHASWIYAVISLLLTEVKQNDLLWWLYPFLPQDCYLIKCSHSHCKNRWCNGMYVSRVTIFTSVGQILYSTLRHCMFWTHCQMPFLLQALPIRRSLILYLRYEARSLVNQQKQGELFHFTKIYYAVISQNTHMIPQSQFTPA